MEKEIFKRKKIDYNLLLSYGFAKDGNVYTYSKTFMQSFRADVCIDDCNNVSGKVYDLEAEEEYTNFRIKNCEGFANAVKEQYISILQDIADNCCQKLYFITNQANSIAKLINAQYGALPEFLWEKYSGHGVFRNESKKWFAIIMCVDKSKIDKNCNGEVEIMNIKVNPQDVERLVKKQGFYSCYHMNKKHWITIILDGTLSDQTIMQYVKQSYIYTA